MAYSVPANTPTPPCARAAATRFSAREAAVSAGEGWRRLAQAYRNAVAVRALQNVTRMKCVPRAENHDARRLQETSMPVMSRFTVPTRPLRASQKDAARRLQPFRAPQTMPGGAR